MTNLQRVIDGLVAGGVRMWVTTAYNTAPGPVVLRIDAYKKDPNPSFIYPELLGQGPMTNARLIITEQDDQADAAIEIEVYHGANGYADGRLVWRGVKSVDEAISFAISEMPSGD